MTLIVVHQVYSVLSDTKVFGKGRENFSNTINRMGHIHRTVVVLILILFYITEQCIVVL